MTSILITGGSGFIGRKLINKLETLGYNYISLNSKYGDINKKSTFFSLPKVKYVFHLAGKSFVPDSWEENNELFITNIIGTKNVLNYCKNVGAKLIMASSYVYGIPEGLPINENHPIKPSNPYALSKYMAEQLVEFEFLNHNLNSVILRLFNIYGNGQRDQFLISKIVKQIKNNSVINVFDLKPKRDFVYIDDVVDAFICAMSLNEGLFKFNIGTGQSFSVEEVIYFIQEILGTSLPICSKEISRNNEISDVKADISYAKSLLNWEPKYNIQDGLKKYIKEVFNKNNN